MAEPRLKIPNLAYPFGENAQYEYFNAETKQTEWKPYEYFDATNNKELQGAIRRTRQRIRQAMGTIVKGEFQIPASTMDALYTLDKQLGKLNYELKLGKEENVEQFEFMEGIDDYQKQMDTLARMGEILKENSTTQLKETGPTVFTFMCGDDSEGAKKDIEILQNNLFVSGTELLNAEAYGKYSEVYELKKTGKPDVSKTAAAWIEQSKEKPFFSVELTESEEWIKHGKDNPFLTRFQTDFDGERFKKDLSVPARIIAARQLADAERGKKDKLGAMLSEQEFLTRAAVLENDETFRKIMSQAKVGAEIEECRSNPRSNGGALEDIMKRELRLLPPGRLPNKPIFERYMPTIKDRIEILQKMAKKGDDTMKLRCAAEIVSLRRLGGAERGKVSSLKKPIPVDEISSLRARTDALSVDPQFKKAMKDPKVLAALVSGHGGKMEQLIKAPDLIAEERAATDPLSIGGRLAELKDNAREMLDKMGSPEVFERMEGEQKNFLIADAKRKIATYISLDVRSRDPKDKTQIDAEKLKEPAGNQHELEGNTTLVYNDKDFQDAVDNLSNKEVYNVMKDMVEKDQQQFMHLLFEKDLVPKFAKQMNAPKVENALKVENEPKKEQDIGAPKLPG